jgi:hypothetical protein
MVYLPVSLDAVELIIDRVFAILKVEQELEEVCPEITLNAAWFKLRGVMTLFEEAKPFIDEKAHSEWSAINDVLCEAMVKIEILAEIAAFTEGKQ